MNNNLNTPNTNAANTRDIRDLFNKTAYDVNGDKLGGIKEVFVDDNTGEPTFVEVNHGLFGLSSSLVPLRGHSFAGDDEVHLAFDKERIKDAPDFDANGALSVEDQNTIYRHYGVDTAENRVNYRRDEHTHGLAGAGHGEVRDGEHRVGVRDGEVRDADARGGIGQHDSESLVRSEERLNVDKERVQTGEARLRKYVVHDTETVEVPVTREEVRVERTPITDADAVKGAAAGGIGQHLGEEEASVTLHEERVQVTKETVPVEEVSLHKDKVRETETVTEDVAKERIEADVDGVKRS